MKLIETWKAFNNTAKVVIAVLAIFVVGGFALSFVRESQAEKWRKGYEAYRDTAAAAIEFGEGQRVIADSAKAFADSIEIKVDSLERKAAILDAEARAARRQNEKLAAANDSIFEELTDGASEEEVLANANPVAKPWIEYALNLRRENASLKLEVDLLGSRVDNLEDVNAAQKLQISGLETALAAQTARADSVTLVLRNLPEPPPTEKILGIIPLPNRKTSLIVGVVVGAVGGYKIAKDM